MKTRLWILPLATLVAALLYLQVWRAAELTPGHLSSPEGLALPLDDAYIFMQYARQALAGQWGHYTPLAPSSSGVSGPLYLLTLTGCMGLGVPGPWAAWWIGALSLGLALSAAWRLGQRLYTHAPGWLLPGLLLAHAAWVASFFQGMDTGLLHALLLWAWIRVSENDQSWRRWATLLALAWARPEGALAALVLGLTAIPHDPRRRWQGPWVVTLALSPALGLWAWSGSWTPDSLRPKLLYNLIPDPSAHAKESLRFVGAAIKDLFLGLGHAKSSVGYLGSATYGNPPAAQLPWMALGVALAGLAWSWRQDARLRALWIGVWLWWVLCLLALAWQIPLGWQRHRYLAPLLTPVTLGVAALLNACYKDVRPLFRTLFVAVSLLWVGHGLYRWPWFLKETQASALGYAATDRQAALMVNASPLAGPLAGADAGLLAWYSGREFVDLLGVTDGALGRARLEGRGALLESLARLGPRRPVLLAVQTGRPDFDVVPLLRLGLLRPLDSASKRQLLYHWDWSGLEAKLNPWNKQALPIDDSLDVAALEDEARHAYHATLHGAKSVMARRRLGATGPLAPEGGRVVQSERFELNAPHGGILWGRAVTDQAGSWSATWQGRPLRTKRMPRSDNQTYTEWSLKLPPGKGRLELRYLDTQNRDVAWASYHYWMVALNKAK